MVIRVLHASTSGHRVHDLPTIKHYLHQWYWNLHGAPYTMRWCACSKIPSDLAFVAIFFLFLILDFLDIPLKVPNYPFNLLIHQI